MIEYIYFVKCPNCEDESFDFFDAAKEFACGCLSQKPIITQVEVNRNDFGECTDSADLGTVWSWEDMMSDTDKEHADEPSLLTKDFLNGLDADNDPEFDALDNSVEVEDDDFRAINDEDLYEAFIGKLCSESDEIDMIEFTELCKEIGIETVSDLERFAKDEADREGTLLDKLKSYRAELGADFKITNESKLTELFGFGKKNRYIVGIGSDKSELVDISILASQVEGILNRNAKDIKAYRDDIETSQRRFFSHHTNANFEFTCDDKTLDKIKQEVSKINPMSVSKDKDPDFEVTSDMVSKLIEFDIVSENVKESTDVELTELFGFGKKKTKKNRYTVKMGRDTSDRLATGDIWREIRRIIKDCVYKVEEYRDDYYSYRTYYEFLATETEFEQIKREINKFLRNLPRRYYVGRDTMNGNYVENPDIKDSIAQLLTFDCTERDVKESFCADAKECRKPVPEGMTIEQLVEEMEENEDIVECTWCNDLFPKDQCRYEVDLGYLCSRCEQAIKSRGEDLTFRENSYWDFLDEDAEIATVSEEPKTRYWMCWYDGDDCCVLEANSESEAEDIFLDRYSNSLFFDSWDHDWSVDEISKEEYDEYLNESLKEHVNEEHPAIESEQELEGTDNAVVDCKVADIITHSEDEKPVDCEGKKKPLEKPLAEALLVDCPECGAKKAFDQESGVCNNCGFIL